MTLEQAIQHCHEKAKELRAEAVLQAHNPECEECASEHEQLAEWLTELKARREAQEHDFCQECVYENTQVCKKCNILKPNMFEPKENDNG